jgi:hypothetical protein
MRGMAPPVLDRAAGNPIATAGNHGLRIQVALYFGLS